MNVPLRAGAALLLGTAIVWWAPLAGLYLAGDPLAPYLHFPPRTQYVPHAPFAWIAFIATLLPVLATLALYAAAFARTRPAPAAAPTPHRFPWWGAIGLALIAGGWVLAWTDSSLLQAWRRSTFTPLWLGYVVTMNALAYRRSGRSPLTHRTAWLAALFAASAVFWWLFEHLNQFTANWYYTGVSVRGDWDYFLQATLPFSTVLPAVASTWAWLQTFPRIEALELPAMRGHRVLAALALAAGTVALAGIGLWPDALYPALWLGPVFVFCGMQQLLLGETLLSPLARGDWRPLLQPALAGLICGFCWELWNAGSLAQWHYSVPYVQRFRLFEMPLLGYAGYLPFGIECALVMDLVARIVEAPRGDGPALAARRARLHSSGHTASTDRG